LTHSALSRHGLLRPWDEAFDEVGPAPDMVRETGSDPVRDSPPIRPRTAKVDREEHLPIQRRTPLKLARARGKKVFGTGIGRNRDTECRIPPRINGNGKHHRLPGP
ncbi:MAG: hypothetical protein PHU46_17160, partial [Rhodocyclaceae bacterium]|nr:hypothetical protein [Rhodocyclaceae bacterium]